MWPFSSAYPIRRIEYVCQNTYDYVVVGGGTAGSSLASRLSDDANVTVLLLEKGPYQDRLLSRVPLASVANGSYAVKRKCTPDAQTGNRSVEILTSETLGGNSKMNGMIYTRGTPAYYRRWGEKHPAWDWPHVEPYFAKVEETVSLRQTDKVQCGLYPQVERSAEKLGLPVERAGNRPGAPSTGCFNLDLTIDSRGYRHSALRAYLPEQLVHRRRDSLHICTEVIVSGLELDNPRNIVLGVYAQPAGQSMTQKPHLIKARREVILTAGSICTPQILQLSGIGQRQLLESLEIPVARDLPGVGRHLADHYLFPVFVEVPIHDSLQHLVASPFQAAKHALLFATLGQGWLQSAVDRAIYFKTSHINEETGEIQVDETTLDPYKPENIPDTELLVVPIGTKPDIYPRKSLFTFQVCLNQARSKGFVTVNSHNPKEDPTIQLNMLQHPDDLEVARKALRFALHLAEEFSFQSEYPHWARPFGGPGSLRWNEGDWRLFSDDELDQYIRKYISPAYHLTSTCHMAKEEEGGVVDEQLRVHGFKNLRVADASVLPTITSSHPMAPTYMVAERCASFIHKTWSRAEP
ncbi:putative GMC oxidoreductase [Hypoxylon sp. CO27-5]|nr:putative GMC oxidoreductase [Hypoxylon sp. CO27-5]